MKIIVCIKQVPDTTDIRWTENNTIIREGVESITNPCDVYAVETGVNVLGLARDATGKGGSVTALTMGPAQAETMLRGAIAAGCEGAVLLSDRKFAGADTLATSRTLAAGVNKILRHSEQGEESLKNFLIVCGQYAIDGDTAQTGPSLANLLGIPQITYVKEVVSVENGYITVKRDLDDGIETVRAKIPALICVVKGDQEPKRPLIDDVIRAQKTQIKTFGADDLGLAVEEVGLKGSPTYVGKSFRMVTPHTPQTVGSVAELVQKVREFG